MHFEHKHSAHSSDRLRDESAILQLQEQIDGKLLTLAEIAEKTTFLIGSLCRRLAEASIRDAGGRNLQNLAEEGDGTMLRIPR